LKCALILRNTFGGNVGGGKDIYNEALAAMQGMVLVPMKPTEQQRYDAGETMCGCHICRCSQSEIYTAMIAPYVNKEEG